MRIYISLAKASTSNSSKLREAGRDADVARVSGTFGEFLDHISQGQDDSSWATRYWIAQTYYTMGESLRAASGVRDESPKADSIAYLTKARDAFRKMLAEAEKDPSVLTSPTAMLAVREAIGRVLPRIGRVPAGARRFLRRCSPNRSRS